MFDKVIKILRQQGVIAYPTEAVYGLGCDPLSELAVKKILSLKERDVSKGLILIAAEWEQIEAFTRPVPEKKLAQALESWPGPFTWLFPASKKAPSWISGIHNTIALRITAHPIAKTICEEFSGPIVSTSANPENQSPAKTADQVRHYFPSGIDMLVSGEVGDLLCPTSIRDVISGELIRS